MRHYPANSALDGFPFLDYIPNRSFPVEGRAHEASLVRGKVRRLLPRLAIAAPGRHGTPPPATTSRREELADGCRGCARCTGLTKSAARTEKSPNWSAVRCPPPGNGRQTEDRLRQAALRSPRFAKRGKTTLRTGEKPGRGADGVCLKGGQMRALGSAALQHTRHARTRAGHDEWRGFVLEYPPTR